MIKESSPAPTQLQRSGGLHLSGALVLACGDTYVCPSGSRIPALSDWPHLPWWLSPCHDVVCSGDGCLVSVDICLVTVTLSALPGGFRLVMVALSCLVGYDSLSVSLLLPVIYDPPPPW